MTSVTKAPKSKRDRKTSQCKKTSKCDQKQVKKQFFIQKIQTRKTYFPPMTINQGNMVTPTTKNKFQIKNKAEKTDSA